MPLLESYLYEIAEIFDTLSQTRDYDGDPKISILLGIFSTFIVSFSKSLLVYVLALIISLVLALFHGKDVLAKIGKISIFLTVMSLVVVSPIIINSLTCSPGEVQSLWEAAGLVLRTVSASTLFAAFLLNLGWTGVLRGLRELRLPEDFSLQVSFMLRYIPLFIRDVFRMLAAREARTFAEKKSYNILSSIVGDLLIRGYYRSQRVQLAMNARLFTTNTKNHSKTSLNRHNIILFLATTILLIASIQGVLAPWTNI